jgi:hypothetical protein
VLGLACGAGAIAFVAVFDAIGAGFKRLPLSNYVKPVVGAALTGLLGLAAWKATGDLSALGVMGSGYGILPQAVSAAGPVGPSLVVLAVVAVGKMVTTGLTIGSGGSGGVFGPSMVIGGCLGGLVGGLFHQWLPHVVPDVGPFTIVGMAGFFAGAANAPISTLLIVSDLSGNYSLFLPAMLVVGISVLVARRWTLYPEQVPTRADSPAHRGEFHRDVLAELTVGSVFDASRKVLSFRPDASLREIVQLISDSPQQYFPVVDEQDRLTGGFTLNELRQVQYEEQVADLGGGQGPGPTGKWRSAPRTACRGRSTCSPSATSPSSRSPPTTEAGGCWACWPVGTSSSPTTRAWRARPTPRRPAARARLEHRRLARQLTPREPPRHATGRHRPHRKLPVLRPRGPLRLGAVVLPARLRLRPGLRRAARPGEGGRAHRPPGRRGGRRAALPAQHQRARDAFRSPEGSFRVVDFARASCSTTGTSGRRSSSA